MHDQDQVDRYGSIGWTIARLARYIEVALLEIDLSPVQYRILFQLGQGPELAKTLAEKLSVSAPNTSVVVDGLVGRGAIQRTQSSDDRRKISLALTPEGARLLALAEAAVNDRVLDIASHSPEPTFAVNALGSMRAWGAALDRFRHRWVARQNAIRRGEEPPTLRNVDVEGLILNAAVTAD